MHLSNEMFQISKLDFPSSSCCFLPYNPSLTGRQQSWASIKLGAFRCIGNELSSFWENGVLFEKVQEKVAVVHQELPSTATCYHHLATVPTLMLLWWDCWRFAGCVSPAADRQASLQTDMADEDHLHSGLSQTDCGCEGILWTWNNGAQDGKVCSKRDIRFHTDSTYQQCIPCNTLIVNEKP